MSYYAEDAWGGVCERRDRPRRPRTPATVERYVTQHWCTRTDLEHPETVDRVRTDLVAEVERWCEATGYLPDRVSWETVPDRMMDTVAIRLIAEVTPRLDGEWPAIHRAVAEDAADRAALQRSSPPPGDR